MTAHSGHASFSWPDDIPERIRERAENAAHELDNVCGGVGADLDLHRDACQRRQVILAKHFLETEKEALAEIAS